MKRKNKALKFERYAQGIKAIREGKPIPRSRAKDGSIPTHPVVKIDKFLTEKGVLKDCLKWLRAKHITCWRHDSGSFQNIRGQWGTYGIIGAGDIIGILPSGTYFEIECKAGKGGRLSWTQQKHRKQIKDAYGIYIVVHGLAELEYYFKDLI